MFIGSGLTVNPTPEQLELLIDNVHRHMQDIFELCNAVLPLEELQQALKQKLMYLLSLKQRPRAGRRDFVVLADNSYACDQLAQQLRTLDFDARVAAAHLQLDVESLSELLLATAFTHSGAAKRVYIFGGEGKLKLTGEPGRGGRCHHLAVLTAHKLLKRGLHAIIGAIATDGADGNTGTAGLLLNTLLLQNRNLEGYLESFNTAALFDNPKLKHMQLAAPGFPTNLNEIYLVAV